MTYEEFIKANGAIRVSVLCSQCGASLVRVGWNYGKNRPIAQFFCDNTCKGAWQRGQREALGFTREWLVEQYITLGRDTNSIAREVGRDGKRVWEWIRDYGILTRPRGHDTSHLIQDGSTFRGKHHTPENRARLRAQRLRDGRVPYLKNGIHWLQHPGAVSPNWKGGITPERQALYGGREWQLVARIVRKRDKSTCQRCGKHSGQGEPLDIHHIVPFECAILRKEPTNLTLLCEVCHYWVHSRENVCAEFIRPVPELEAQSA